MHGQESSHTKIRDAEDGFKVLSLNDFDSKVRNYRRRKLHEKTRSGCLSCKAKKVKCDKSRPVCLRCQRNSRSCVYSEPDGIGSNSSSSSKIITAVAAIPTHSSPCSGLTALTLVPFPLPSAPPRPPPWRRNGTPSLHLMQHFHAHWADVLVIPRTPQILALSRSDPLVRSVLLAIAASHLRHLSPGAPQHRVAEHFHFGRAIAAYRQNLALPEAALRQADVDSVLLGAVLLNLLSFALPAAEAPSTTATARAAAGTRCGRGGDATGAEEAEAQEEGGSCDVRASWIFSPRDERLDWLSLQVSFMAVMRSRQAYVESTMRFICPILFGADPQNWASAKMRRGGLDGGDVPERWIGFFGLDRGASLRGGCVAAPSSASVAGPANDVYRPPVLILARLRRLEPVRPNILRNLQFVGKVQDEYRSLVRIRDPRALWLFGYWLGLMCRFKGIWWCGMRARRDYKAIRMWLEQLHLTDRPGVEGETWRAMMRELELAPLFPCHD